MIDWRKEAVDQPLHALWAGATFFLPWLVCHVEHPASWTFML